MYGSASESVCCLTRTVDVGGIAGEYELVVVSLGGERFGHTLVGDNPIVHVIAHYVRIRQIAVANFQPDSWRLGVFSGMRCS